MTVWVSSHVHLCTPEDQERLSVCLVIINISKVFLFYLLCNLIADIFRSYETSHDLFQSLSRPVMCCRTSAKEGHTWWKCVGMSLNQWRTFTITQRGLDPPFFILLWISKVNFYSVITFVSPGNVFYNYLIRSVSEPCSAPFGCMVFWHISLACLLWYWIKSWFNFFNCTVMIPS